MITINKKIIIITYKKNLSILTIIKIFPPLEPISLTIFRPIEPYNLFLIPEKPLHSSPLSTNNNSNNHNNKINNS